MIDLLIKNALIYDGSGEPAFMGNVTVTDGKIETFAFSAEKTRPEREAAATLIQP